VEIDLCKDKIKRNQLIARLRNLGNHCHNVEVMQKREGEIMVTHRKTVATDATEYVPCDHIIAIPMHRRGSCGDTSVELENHRRAEKPIRHNYYCLLLLACLVQSMNCYLL